MDAGGRKQQKGMGMRTRKTCLQIQSKAPPGSKIKASLNKTPKSLLGADAGQWLGRQRKQHGARTSLLHVVDHGQDAHLLLGRVHILILLLGHSCAQAIEAPTILGIINTVLKE